MAHVVYLPWKGNYSGKRCAICGDTPAGKFTARADGGREWILATVHFCKEHLERGKLVEAIFQTSGWYIKFPFREIAEENEVPTEDETDQPKGRFVAFLEVLAFICFCALIGLVLFM